MGLFCGFGAEASGPKSSASGLRPYYLFVVWMALHAVYSTYDRTLSTTRLQSSGEVLAQLLYPSSSLWFLYALGCISRWPMA